MLGSAMGERVISSKLAGLFLPVFLAGFGAMSQETYVNWDNRADPGTVSSSKHIFTNDCAGAIGKTKGTDGYRFGLYVGPLGSTAEGLQLAILVTNNPVTLGGFNAMVTQVPPLFTPGTPMAFQVRGWTLSAGATFEEASASAAPDTYLGVSDLGSVTPSQDPETAPRLFGSEPGQIGGFELRNGDCREVAFRRMAPDGPVWIKGITGEGLITWTNVLASTGTYNLGAGATLGGPYTNYATLPPDTFEVAFTNAYDPHRFFRIEWADAPPAAPVGTWDYQAFDPDGRVMVAGILTFTSNVPSTVTHHLSGVQLGAPGGNLHPTGSRTSDAYSIGSPHRIELFYSNEFRLRGQMTGDYFAGNWFVTDFQFVIFDPPSAPLAVIRSGRFIARRR